jgi:hypothetical protein
VVSLWVDLGILGPTLYLSMLGYLIWRCVRTRLRGLYALVPVCFFIPFSQVLVELPSYWITAAVVALVTSPHRYRFGLGLLAPRRHPSPQTDPTYA